LPRNGATWLVVFCHRGFVSHKPVPLRRAGLGDQAAAAQAAHLIKKGEKDDSVAWQEETFSGRGVLYAHWTEYLNNLFFADGALP
jgi:hypothetical protein